MSLILLVAIMSGGLLKVNSKNIILYKFPLDKIIKLIGTNDKIKLHNYNVKISTKRLKLFKTNQSCVVCKIVADHFKLELTPNAKSPHLNMYSGDILMTKDHIVPVSLGGKDSLDNLQTMCYRCNRSKGNRIVSIEKLITEIKNEF